MIRSGAEEGSSGTVACDEDLSKTFIDPFMVELASFPVFPGTLNLKVSVCFRGSLSRLIDLLPLVLPPSPVVPALRDLSLSFSI
jgi:hypothetical protein